MQPLPLHIDVCRVEHRLLRVASAESSYTSFCEPPQPLSLKERIDGSARGVRAELLRADKRPRSRIFSRKDRAPSPMLRVVRCDGRGLSKQLRADLESLSDDAPHLADRRDMSRCTIVPRGSETSLLRVGSSSRRDFVSDFSRHSAASSIATCPGRGNRLAATRFLFAEPERAWRLWIGSAIEGPPVTERRDGASSAGCASALAFGSTCLLGRRLPKTSRTACLAAFFTSARLSSSSASSPDTSRCDLRRCALDIVRAACLSCSCFSRSSEARPRY